MSDQPDQQPQEAPQTQTETAPPQQDRSEISSLRNYMQRQRDSSPVAKESPEGGEGTPTSAAAPQQPQDDGRSQYIPRDRFDQVLQERNQLRQQMEQAPQPQVPQQQQPVQYNTGMVPQMQVPQQQMPPQPQQGFQSPTGMVGQPAQPQQQGVSAPDFNDPAVQKEWREKIQNNPVTGLRDFFSTLLQAEGGPLLEQFRQEIMGQLSPIQQSYVQQQLSSYSSQRAQQDPSFQQVQPVFQQLVSRAQQQGYALTPDTLRAIEGIARAQVGFPTSAPQPQAQVPFTEQPGSTGNLGQPEQPKLTPQEQQVAQRFGMSAAEYHEWRNR